MSEHSPKESQRPPRPPFISKEPKITILYDTQDVPDWLPHGEVTRDKSQADVLRYIPRSSLGSSVETLQNFFNEYAEDILKSTEFRQLWFNGDMYNLQTRKLLTPEKPVEKSSKIEQLPSYTTKEAVAKLKQLLAPLQFIDPNLSLRVNALSYAASHPELPGSSSTTDEYLVVTIVHQEFGETQLHRIGASSFSDGDYFYGGNYNYTFDDQQVLTAIKEKLAAKPLLALKSSTG